ncbi:MAG: competence type IV pilus major pilin ComGC [Planctomycetota bacterium]|jgi:general secretion pathway protein G
MKARKGFTLVLGILAAIVIPQFTNASTEAKQASLRSNLQTFRAQIELYKIKNNDTPPATLATLVTANYIQAIPVNPYNGSATETTGGGNVVGSTDGWAYDAATGEVHAADSVGYAAE